MGWTYDYDPTTGNVKKTWVPRSAKEKAALKSERQAKRRSARRREVNKNLGRKTESKKSLRKSQQSDTKTRQQTADTKQSAKADEADEAARVKAEQAAQAAAEERARKKLLSEADKVNARLEQQVSKFNAQREQTLAQIEKKRAAVDAAAEAGDWGAVGRLNREVQEAGARLLDIERKELDAYGYKRRKDANGAVWERIAVTNAGVGYSGAKIGDPDGILTPTQRLNRYRAEASAGTRGSYEQKTPKTKPGDTGHSKSLRRGLVNEIAYQSRNPDLWDTPEGRHAAGGMLDEYAKQIVKHQDLFVVDWNKSLDKEQRLLKTLKQAKRTYKQDKTEANFKVWEQASEKYQALVGSTEFGRQRAEAKALWGTPPALGEPGDAYAIRHRGNPGLVALYSMGTERILKEVKNRQNVMLYGAGVPGFLRRVGANASNIAWAAHVEATRGTVVMENGLERRQTSEERWAEVMAEQFGAGVEQSVKGVAAAEYENFEAAAVAKAKDPLLGPLYKNMQERGIESINDLDRPENIYDFKFNIAGKATLDWWEWHVEESGEFVDPVVGAVWDATRYGWDNTLFQPYFVNKDGTRRYPNDPAPEGEITAPLWDLVRPQGEWALQAEMGIDTPVTVLLDPIAMEERKVTSFSRYMTGMMNAQMKRAYNEVGIDPPSDLDMFLEQNFLMQGFTVLEGLALVPAHLLSQVTGKKTGIGIGRDTTGFDTAISQDPERFAREALAEAKKHEDWEVPSVLSGIYDLSRYEIIDGEETFRTTDDRVITRGWRTRGGFEPLWDAVFRTPDAHRNFRFENLKKNAQARYEDKIYRGLLADAKGPMGGSTDRVPTKDFTSIREAKPYDSGWGIFGVLLDALGIQNGTEAVTKDGGQTVREFSYGVGGWEFYEFKRWGEKVEEEIAETGKSIEEASDFIVQMYTMREEVKYFEGNLGDLLNEVTIAVLDISNWVPVVNVFRRTKNAGQAVRAARAAGLSVDGRVGSALAYAREFTTVWREAPDVHAMNAAMLRDLKSVVPGMTDQEASQVLRGVMYGIDGDIVEESDLIRALDQMVEHMSEQMRLIGKPVNRQQLHYWLEERIVQLLKSKGIKVMGAVEDAEAKRLLDLANSNERNEQARNMHYDEKRNRVMGEEALKEGKNAKVKAQDIARENARATLEAEEALPSVRPRSAAAGAPQPKQASKGGGNKASMLTGEFAAEVANEPKVAARHLKGVRDNDALSADAMQYATVDEFNASVKEVTDSMGWDVRPTDADVEAEAIRRFGDEPTDDQFHSVRNEMFAEVRAQNDSVNEAIAVRLSEKVEARLKKGFREELKEQAAQRTRDIKKADDEVAFLEARRRRLSSALEGATESQRKRINQRLAILDESIDRAKKERASVRRAETRARQTNERLADEARAARETAERQRLDEAIRYGAVRDSEGRVLSRKALDERIKQSEAALEQRRAAAPDAKTRAEIARLETGLDALRREQATTSRGKKLDKEQTAARIAKLTEEIGEAKRVLSGGATQARMAKSLGEIETATKEIERLKAIRGQMREDFEFQKKLAVEGKRLAKEAELVGSEAEKAAVGFVFKHMRAAGREPVNMQQFSKDLAELTDEIEAWETVAHKALDEAKPLGYPRAKNVDSAKKRADIARKERELRFLLDYATHELAMRLRVDFVSSATRAERNFGQQLRALGFKKTWNTAYDYSRARPAKQLRSSGSRAATTRTGENFKELDYDDWWGTEVSGSPNLPAQKAEYELGRRERETAGWPPTRADRGVPLASYGYRVPDLPPGSLYLSDEKKKGLWSSLVFVYEQGNDAERLVAAEKIADIADLEWYRYTRANDQNIPASFDVRLANVRTEADLAQMRTNSRMIAVEQSRSRYGNPDEGLFLVVDGEGRSGWARVPRHLREDSPEVQAREAARELAEEVDERGETLDFLLEASTYGRVAQLEEVPPGAHSLGKQMHEYLDVNGRYATEEFYKPFHEFDANDLWVTYDRHPELKKLHAEFMGSTVNVQNMTMERFMRFLTDWQLARLDALDQTGVYAYKKGFQPFYDLQNQLQIGKKDDLLIAIHDYFVENLDELIKNGYGDIATSWLMLEVHTGWKHAMSPSVISSIFERTISKFGLPPTDAAMMLGTRYGLANGKRVVHDIGRQRFLSPTMQLLLDADAGLRQADGTKKSWMTRAPDLWFEVKSALERVPFRVKFGEKVVTVKERLVDGVHWLYDADISVLDMHRASRQFMDAGDHHYGKWFFGRGLWDSKKKKKLSGTDRDNLFRRQMRERGAVQLLRNAFGKVDTHGKFQYTSPEMRNEVKNLWWNGQLREGRLDTAILDYDPDTHEFIIDVDHFYGDTARLTDGDRVDYATLEMLYKDGAVKVMPAQTFEEFESIAAKKVYAMDVAGSYIKTEKNPMGLNRQVGRVQTRSTGLIEFGDRSTDRFTTLGDGRDGIGSLVGVGEGYERGLSGRGIKTQRYRRILPQTPNEVVWDYVASMSYWTDLESISKSISQSEQFLDDMARLAKQLDRPDLIEDSRALVNDIFAPHFRNMHERLEGLAGSTIEPKKSWFKGKDKEQQYRAAKELFDRSEQNAHRSARHFLGTLRGSKPDATAAFYMKVNAQNAADMWKAARRNSERKMQGALDYQYEVVEATSLEELRKALHMQIQDAVERSKNKRVPKAEREAAAAEARELQYQLDDTYLSGKKEDQTLTPDEVASRGHLSPPIENIEHQLGLLGENAEPSDFKGLADRAFRLVMDPGMSAEDQMAALDILFAIVNDPRSGPVGADLLNRVRRAKYMEKDWKATRADMEADKFAADGLDKAATLSTERVLGPAPIGPGHAFESNRVAWRRMWEERREYIFNARRRAFQKRQKKDVAHQRPEKGSGSRKWSQKVGKNRAAQEETHKAIDGRGHKRDGTYTVNAPDGGTFTILHATDDFINLTKPREVKVASQQVRYPSLEPYDPVDPKKLPDEARQVATKEGPLSGEALVGRTKEGRNIYSEVDQQVLAESIWEVYEAGDGRILEAMDKAADSEERLHILAKEVRQTYVNRTGEKRWGMEPEDYQDRMALEAEEIPTPPMNERPQAKGITHQKLRQQVADTPKEFLYGNEVPNPHVQAILFTDSRVPDGVGGLVKEVRDLNKLADDLSEAGVEDLKYLDRGKDTAVYEATVNGEKLVVRLSVHSKHLFPNAPGVIQPLNRGSSDGVYWAVMPHAETAGVTQQHVDEVAKMLDDAGWEFSDVAIDNVGLVDGQPVALDPESVSWKGDGPAPQPNAPLPSGNTIDHGPIPEEVPQGVPERMAMDEVWRRLGKTEEDYYWTMVRANRREINKGTTTPERKAILEEENRTFIRALAYIRYQKRVHRASDTTRTVSAAKGMMNKADKGLLDRIKGVIPPRAVAFFAGEPGGFRIEAARSIHVKLRSSTYQGEGLPRSVMIAYRPEHYQGLDRAVQEAITDARDGWHRQHATDIGRATSDKRGSHLPTKRDKDAAIIAAKKRAIKEYCDTHGIPVWDIELYDRVRTLTGTERRKLQAGERIFRETGGEPTAFLAHRLTKADDDAYKHIERLLVENPRWSVEDAVNYFELTNLTDGSLKQQEYMLYNSDKEIFEGMFRHWSGADPNDPVATRNALQSHGTMPPLHKKAEFREYQEQIGEWSPRKLDEVLANESWSLEDERTWFFQRYGEYPAWTEHPAIRDGSAFNDKASMDQMLREIGQFDDSMQIERMQAGETVIDYDTLITGKLIDESRPDLGYAIKPRKDLREQRKYMIERYGSLITDPKNPERLVKVPWLMYPDELIEYTTLNVGVVDDLITNADEIREVQNVIEEYARSVANELAAMHGKADGAAVVVRSEDIHRAIFPLVQKLMLTTPWRSLREQAGPAALNLWAGVWRGVILMNPGFITSNLVDSLSKGIVFGVFDPMASFRSYDRGRAAIQALADAGLDDSTAFFGGTGGRELAQRLKDPQSMRDGMGAWGELVTTQLAKKILTPVEKHAKLKLAQQLYQGIWDEMAPRYLGKTINGNVVGEETLDVLVKLQVQRRVNKIFPTLEDAGFAERLLNKFAPFISYNAKNLIIWTGFMLDHPMLMHWVGKSQELLQFHNRREWEKRHPGEEMPENLTHQINIPGTDMYFDIGQLTDAARGGDLVAGKVTSLGGLVERIIRPLPAQRAFLGQVVWELTGWNGRWVWQRVLDENGHFSNEYERVKVAPGTPWGDRPLDIYADLIPFGTWGQSISEAIEDGSLSYEDMVRIAGDVLLFGEFAEPSRYQLLNTGFFALLEKDEEAARKWLYETDDGKQLQEYWNMNYWDSDRVPEFQSGFEAKYDPFVTMFLDDGMPTREEFRKAWLGQQPPEVKQAMFEKWAELDVAYATWDGIIDSLADADQATRDLAWMSRRTAIAHIYHSNHDLWFYQGLAMDTDEVSKQAKDFLTDQNERIFRELYSGTAPHITDFDSTEAYEAARADWEKSREDFLKANPDVAQRFADSASGFQKAMNKHSKTIERTLAVSELRNKVRDAATFMQDYDLREATYRADDLRSMVFEADVIGIDKEGKAKVHRDSRTRRLARGEDPDVVYYKEAIAGVRNRSKNDKGFVDKGKFWDAVNADPRLKTQYFSHNPEAQATWQRDGRLWKLQSRYFAHADKEQWDKAWEVFDNAPPALQQAWREANPAQFRRLEKSSRYSASMGTWVGLFDTKGPEAAMNYFYNLPKWMRDQYYENNPGKQLSEGRNLEYIEMLDSMFAQIDAGNWDAAERIWNNAPAYMRTQYYTNNPDSTLFRGKKGGGSYSSGYKSSGKSSASLTDPQFRTYTKMMGKWVELQRSGKHDEARNYFRSLPKWAQEFYLARNGDKRLMLQDDRMIALVARYLGADAAHQRQMLRDNPALGRWLNENSTEEKYVNAIKFAYSELPDDPWLKRVYREKYPEIFGEEAVGQAKIDAVMETLQEYPDFIEPWMRWYESITKSAIEALKYSSARPKPFEVDHTRIATTSRGMSAEEVADRQKQAWERDRKDEGRAKRIS